MTKQEEIRERIKKIIEPLNIVIAQEFACSEEKETEIIETDSYEVADNIINYLLSQGVVLNVESLIEEE